MEQRLTKERLLPRFYYSKNLSWPGNSGVEQPAVNHAIVNLANQYFPGPQAKVMYCYIGEETIEIHPVWWEYLSRNITILRGFICWELSKFLQKNNPNVVGIPEKLFKPEARDLKKAIRYWSTYAALNQEIRCIYTNQILPKADQSIDHFIPWSYVVHDAI